MIKILGVKRVMTLLVLVAVNAVLAGVLFYALTPQHTKAERELRSTRSAVSARRGEIATLKTEYEQIREQKGLFENLESAGFFSTQDRVAARRLIEQIQSQSGVLAARYDIQAVRVEEHPTAAVADHVLLTSPVKVSLDALDDVDVYKFMYWVENAFPGHAGVTNMTLQRNLDVDEVTLKQIGNGIPVVLVSATVDFSWNTMIPRDKIPEQLTQPGGPR